MPSTKVLRATLAGITVVILAVVALSVLGRQPELQPSAAAAEEYRLATSPDDLPQTIRVALARETGQGALRMAAAGRPYAAGDVVGGDSLPDRRLVCAAVGRRYVVVQFEMGGMSPQLHTVAFHRGFWRSYAVWWGSGPLFREPDELVAAIRKGTLWRAGAGPAS